MARPGIWLTGSTCTLNYGGLRRHRTGQDSPWRPSCDPRSLASTLVVAADGVHTTAIHQVIGHATPAVATGSAAFRFLIPTEDIQGDPETAHLLEDGLMRIYVAEGVRRLIWYSCAE